MHDLHGCVIGFATYVFNYTFVGKIHTNGGSATSSGGGGGGYVAIKYTSGFVDDRDITCYGGTTSNGENAAAGVIYLEKSGSRKVK